LLGCLDGDDPLPKKAERIGLRIDERTNKISPRTGIDRSVDQAYPRSGIGRIMYRASMIGHP